MFSDLRNVVRVAAGPEGGTARAADGDVSIVAIELNTLVLQSPDVGQVGGAVLIVSVPSPAVC